METRAAFLSFYFGHDVQAKNGNEGAKSLIDHVETCFAHNVCQTAISSHKCSNCHAISYCDKKYQDGMERQIESPA